MLETSAFKLFMQGVKFIFFSDSHFLVAIFKDRQDLSYAVSILDRPKIKVKEKIFNVLQSGH